MKFDRKTYLKKHARKYYSKNKEKLLLYQRQYRKQHKNKIKLYQKQYYKLNKKEINKYNTMKKILRKKTDKGFKIGEGLRIRVLHAFNKYTKTGKIQTSKQYGINYELIINYLKPFPKNINKYHIDHIRPLCSFDLTKEEEIKKAFAPENHQWLLAKDNLIKTVQDKKISIHKKI